MKTKNRILLESKAWVKEKLSNDANYFKQLQGLHNPDILWIASTDSLVPIQELVNAEPGDLLVYTNMGVQIRADDISFMAILEEAIEVSKVKHIVICGYSNCDGIRDVLYKKDDNSAVQHWLKNLRALYEKHKPEFEKLSQEEKEKHLHELNIRQQVENLSKLPIIQKAWEKTDYPKIFGWYFDLSVGSLSEIYSLELNHKQPVSILTESV